MFESIKTYEFRDLSNGKNSLKGTTTHTPPAITGQQTSSTRKGCDEALHNI